MQRSRHPKLEHLFHRGGQTEPRRPLRSRQPIWQAHRFLRLVSSCQAHLKRRQTRLQLFYQIASRASRRDPDVLARLARQIRHEHRCARPTVATARCWNDARRSATESRHLPSNSHLPRPAQQGLSKPSFLK